MTQTRTRLLGVLVAVIVLSVLVVATAGMVPGLLSDGPTPDSESDAESTSDDSASEHPPDDRPDNATTTETIGYVEGYWYDDSLAVDDQDDAVVDEADLESVIYRSMARVEVIRDLPFEDDVPVDVISREEFQEDNDDLFVDVTDDERIQENANYETLFMVERDDDAVDAVEAMYGGTVGGYYDPETDEVVIVSDNPETPELDEVILGHELLHALQDQHFDLSTFDRETVDQDNAKNGLIEGDAVWVEREYEQRCADEWACLPATTDSEEPLDPNWGVYLAVFQPYEDGPDYVEYLLDQNDWDAVDAAYDDPPTSSSEVIRPGDEREPADIAVDDRSSDDWQQLEVNGAVANETVGEAGMVAMFGAGALEDGEPTVIGELSLIGTDPSIEYDHDVTDGWAGDELVTYVSDDGLAADDPADAVSHTGSVWETQWTSSEDAAQFHEGYLELLEGYDAEPVDDREHTYEIDTDAYPGAYYLEHSDDGDGETVTIVRAPSVDALEEIEDGAAPEDADADTATAGLSAPAVVGLAAASGRFAADKRR
ncbi:hypothetical protein G6M89_04990 [Natronolimnobius sp. AArcel1]|uniref:Hvo_1808 family surface protein n=1 Tax=Natronolimnobius sp. AArcel1 TaxID=1679093 RepID=UPI0013EA0A9A|nr:Hvo_1808 family surface protein [Natronolimnobius sp. AArcel1]NGM68368.1 hypothetical protein [Natronolimnobius sp. AArcel1]